MIPDTGTPASDDQGRCGSHGFKGGCISHQGGCVGFGGGQHKLGDAGQTEAVEAEGER